MTVKPPMCSRNDLAAVLNVTAGERILYEMWFEGGAQPLFAIVDQHGTVVLSQSHAPDHDGAYRRIWPSDLSNIEIPNYLTHMCGMHFALATRYHWRVTRLDVNGDAIEIHKDCTYESDPHDSRDEWFAPFRVFTI